MKVYLLASNCWILFFDKTPDFVTTVVLSIAQREVRNGIHPS